MKWTITPILAGEFGMVRDDIKYVSGDPSVTGMVPSIIFSLKSKLGTVLVDTSFGDPEHCASVLNLEVRREDPYLDNLEKYGVHPDEVRAIILTHLDWDHADNLALFPSSVIYCQIKEMEAFESSDSLYRENIEKSSERMLLLDGDQEILPGISVHLAGGHTKGLQMVSVETANGKALLPSDNVMTFRNFEQKIPVGLCHDPIACQEALQWARETFSIVYPSHDYKTVREQHHE
jgi:glyoxylase-like metal-dependent hydrolase (beta-lactamase superfamily II)